MSRRRLHVTLILVAFALVLGVTNAVLAQEGTPDPSVNASRVLLASGQPAAAPGNVLGLYQVVIPAGFKLDPHVHPGLQAAWIASGTLHYTIIRGEALVTRANPDGTPGTTVETFADGTELDLNPGDSLVETEGLIHFAENRTDAPVVIYTASLFTEGEPPSHPIDLSATPVG